MHRPAIATAATALLLTLAGCSSAPAPASSFPAADLAKFNELMTLTPVGAPADELASAEKLCSDLRANQPAAAAMAGPVRQWSGGHAMVLAAAASISLCTDQQAKIKTWIITRG